MDRSYEGYCLINHQFYDNPMLARWDDVDFSTASLPVPDGWRRVELEDWLVYGPDPLDVPTQGWKIHVSACLDNPAEILEATWDYCIERGIAFKFVRSKQLLLLGNGN